MLVQQARQRLARRAAVRWLALQGPVQAAWDVRQIGARAAQGIAQRAALPEAVLLQESVREELPAYCVGRRFPATGTGLLY